MDGIFKGGLEVLSAKKTGGFFSAGLLAAQKLASGIEETKGVFLGAKAQAKLCGKLLGCCIALKAPL